MSLEARQLKNVGLFKLLDDREVKELLPRIIPRSFGQGDYIFAEGDEADSLFLILDGGVVIQMEGERGPQTIAELQAGEHFGELPFFDLQRRVASAVALEGTEIAELPYAALEEVAATSAQTGRKLYYMFARALCQRMRMTDVDLADFRDSFPFFAT